MKILLTLNKTYRNQPDMGYWYVYLPLRELGHEIYWYDTVSPVEQDYRKIIEQFKPDLIFCCMTGDHYIAPFEPWEEIKKETDSGRIKTFNWFADDTWRFETFSKTACHCFNICSTTEPSYVEKYRDIGYNNIIIGNWHANSVFYHRVSFQDKDIELSFIGSPNPHRDSFFGRIKNTPVERIFGISQEEMFKVHSRTKIGINLSVNANDIEMKTQMKQRLFEISAGGALLLTEYHKGIEEFFDIDKEIVTFVTPKECSEKAKILLKNPNILNNIAAAGHKRFLLEHDSKVRLRKLLQQIGQA